MLTLRDFTEWASSCEVLITESGPVKLTSRIYAMQAYCVYDGEDLVMRTGDISKAIDEFNSRCEA